VNDSERRIQYRCRLNSSRGRGRRIALLGSKTVGRSMGRLVPEAGGRIGLIEAVSVIEGTGSAKQTKKKKKMKRTRRTTVGRWQCSTTLSCVIARGECFYLKRIFVVSMKQRDRTRRIIENK